MRAGNVLEVHGGQSRIYLDHLSLVLMAKAQDGTLCVGAPNSLVALLLRTAAKRHRKSTPKRKP